MKLLLLASLFVLAPASALGQSPPIGIIDFYGLRSVSEKDLRQALQIAEGDSVPKSPEAAQRRLEELPNVQQARLNFACCEGGKSILYVGIREKGSPSLRFRSAPNGAIRLPETIVKAGEAFWDALTEGILKGDAGEDDSQGHALNSYPKARAFQERFIIFAAQDLTLLRAVLHESADAQHRALAAQVIAYSANKRDAVKELLYGMTDSDSNVRNTSMRGLGVIATFARRSPKQRINIPFKPFIDMLNSIVWTDRNKSSLTLLRLTEQRNASLLSQLRARALLSLVEMSRWKSPGHALPAFFMLGRVGNLSEDEINKDWESGNRETLIEKVLKKAQTQ
jgi:hypothetical protein